MGALLGGIGLLTLAGVAIYNAFSSDTPSYQEQIDMQKELNKETADYQQQLNQEAWERSNEYNSPANNVARYRAAGLNPILAGVNGSNSQLSSAVVGGIDAFEAVANQMQGRNNMMQYISQANQAFSGLGHMVDSYKLGIQQQREDINVAEADARLTNAKAEEQERLNAEAKEENQIFASGGPAIYEYKSNADGSYNVSMPVVKSKRGYEASMIMLRHEQRFFDANKETSVSHLQAQVAKLQDNNELAGELAQLPHKDFEILCEKAIQAGLQSSYDNKRNEMQITDKSIQEFEYDMMKNSSLKALITKIQKHGFETSDIIPLILSVLSSFSYSGKHVRFQP